MDFKSMIEDDREALADRPSTCSFLEYLDLVKKNPSLAKLAHQRIYDMIIQPGYEMLDPDKDIVYKRLFGHRKVKSYNFFSPEFFGIENVIQQIVRYFHSASLLGEESRQVLYLVGPVGAGKSSLIDKLKKGLEQLPPIYTIEGCPIHEEPLHLLPPRVRPKFEKALKLKVEGELCPVCRYHLDNNHNGKYEDMPITTFTFSVTGRRGVGVVPPVDPNNQDTSVLIGSEDISKMEKYSEDDPRVLTLNGAFNAGNRGIVEFIEVFKNEVEYLHVMITATQEKSIPAPGKNAMIYFDGVILAHSNAAEWDKFRADHTNEAILDRIVKIEVPYVLELSEEIRIYEKMLSNSNFDAHVAPHTIEMASMFAILTRLKETNKCDLLTKLKLYNGEEITEKGQTKRINVQELKEEFPEEGMTGISTRFIMKSLDDALSDSEHQCINPIYVLDALQNRLKEEHIAGDLKETWMGFLKDTVYKEYLKVLEKEITKAFVYSYEEQAESLFQNYLDHVEAYVLKKKVVDPNTKEEMEPDEDFLKSIEEQLGISGSSADGFRQDVMSYTSHVLRKGGEMDYKSYEPLKEAIEKKLMASVKEITRIISKTKTRDEQQKKKYDNLVKTMMDNGYCEHCCEVILKFAANNLWKD